MANTQNKPIVKAGGPSFIETVTITANKTKKRQWFSRIKRKLQK